MKRLPAHPFAEPGRDLRPWLVGAAACLLYLLTLSNHYSGDSIEYALAIESGERGLLLDPYHPLMHPLGLLFYRLWQAAGWTGRALAPLQVLNALAGGLCAGLVTAIAGRLHRNHPGGSRRGALAAAAGVGFAVSGGSWMLSVEAEFVTPALALLLAVLWVLLGASPATAARRSYPVLLAAATAVAVAGYVSSALVVPVVLVGLLADDRLAPAVRRRHCLAYVATVLLLSAPAYLMFLAAWSGGRWEYVPAYFFGRSYGHFTLLNLPHGIYAFLRSLALYPHLSLGGTTRDLLARASTAGRLLFAGYHGLILLAVLAPIGLAWRHRRRLWHGARRPLLVLGTWATVFAAFGFYWTPGDQSFWLPVLGAWWLLVALVAAAGNAETAGRSLTVLLVAVVGLAAGNALFEVIPRHDIRRNAAYQMAGQVRAHTTPEDVVLARGNDIVGLYLTYLDDRQVLYVPSEPEEDLWESLFHVPAVQAADRLVVIDSDDRRAARWQELLELLQKRTPGRWFGSAPDWHTGSGLVFELNSMMETR